MRSLVVGVLLVLVSTLAATPTEAVLIEGHPRTARASHQVSGLQS